MSKHNKTSKFTFDSDKEFLLETLEPRMLLSADGLLPPDVLDSYQDETGIVEELVADESLLEATHFQLKEEDGQIQVLDTTDLSHVPVVSPDAQDLINTQNTQSSQTKSSQDAESKITSEAHHSVADTTPTTNPASENSVAFQTVIQAKSIVIIDSRVEEVEQLLVGISLDTQTESANNADTNLQSVLPSDSLSVESNSPNTTNNWLIINLSDSNTDIPQNIQSGQKIAYIVDEQRDGIEQINQILSQYTELDSIHIFSHASSGALLLGAGRITANTLQQESRKVQNWGNALTEQGDILLYGCSVAANESGQQLVEELARLTQADVAASVDNTGADSLGGDWDLEYRAGTIETSYQADNYQSLLVDTDTTPGTAIAENSDFSTTSSQFVVLDEATDTLDLSNVSGNLNIFVRADGTIEVSKGTNPQTTYQPELNGSLQNLKLGAGSHKLTFDEKAELRGTLEAVTSGVNLALEYRGADGKGSYVTLASSKAILPRIDSVEGNFNFTSITTGDSKDVLRGSDLQDFLYGGQGNDWLYAGGGNDKLYGQAGDDILTGIAGVNILDGGMGNDSYIFDFDEQSNASITNTVVESTDAGDDLLDFSRVEADLNFTLDNSGLKATASQVVNVPTTPVDRSTNGPVYLQLDSAQYPVVSNGQLSVSDISFYLDINGNASPELFTVSLTQSELDAELDSLTTDTPASSVDGLSFSAIAGKLWLNYTEGNVAFWNQSEASVVNANIPSPDREVRSKNGASVDMMLADYLPMPVAGETMAEKKITLALGNYTDASGKIKTDSLIEVTLYEGGKVYNGSASAIRQAWLDDLEQAFGQAQVQESIQLDDSQMQKIAVDLFQKKIQDEIGSRYNILAPYNIYTQLQQNAQGTELILTLKDASELAISHTTFGQLTQNKNFTLNSAKNIELIKTQVNDQVSSNFKITEFNQSLSILNDADVIKSELDFSAITQDLTYYINGLGEVRVELDGSDFVISAQGIASLTMGTGRNTLVYTANGQLPGLITITNPASEYILKIAADFKAEQVYINNSDSDYTLEDKTLLPRTLVFEGADVLSAQFSEAIIFSNVFIDTGFKGQVFINDDINSQANNISTGMGDDLINLSSNSTAEVNSGGGDDFILGNSRSNTLDGGADNDRLIGNQGDDILIGGAGDDVLLGGEGNDTLRGKTGDDRLNGGAGTDTLIGGAGNDRYQFNGNWGQDTIVEEKNQGDNDVIDFSRVTEDMVHIISDNNYKASNGSADPIIAEQDKLTGTTRSNGVVNSSLLGGTNSVEVVNEQFKYIERINASAANNNFYFGNKWAPGAYASTLAAKAVPFGDRIPFFDSDRTLVVDTQLTIENGFDLVLDFRAVTQTLKFTFTKESDGSTSLEVLKLSSFPVPFVDLGDLEKLQFNKIKFTHVNENTIIYGGRENNTFAVKGKDTDFAGTIIGGEGLRQLNEGASIGTLAKLSPLMGGNLPDFFVSNTIDYSKAGVQVRTGSLLTTSEKVDVDVIKNKIQFISSDLTQSTFNIKYGNQETNLLYNISNDDLKAAINNLVQNSDGISNAVNSLVKVDNGWIVTFDEDRFSKSIKSIKASLENSSVSASDANVYANDISNTLQTINSTLGNKNFNLYYQGLLLGSFNDQSTTIEIKNALVTKLELTDSKVSVNKTANADGSVSWTINLDISDFPDNKIAKLVARSEDYSQSFSKGFSGQVLNISNINYGTGSNLLMGSNIGISEQDLRTVKDAVAGSNGKLGAMESALAGLSDSVWEQAKSGSLMGSNTFSIGGNFARDLLLDKLLDGKVNSQSFSARMMTSMLGPVMDGTLSPGVHILSGATGGDTYQFEGIWGAAAVLELPDLLNGSGQALIPEGYDTFDFSKVKSDLDIQIIKLDSGNLLAWADKLAEIAAAMADKLGVEVETIDVPDLSVGMNLVIAQDNAFEDLLNGYVPDSINFDDILPSALQGNIVIGTDIENIITGAGTTTVKFVGDASVQGTITKGSGKLTLDYSEYSGSAITDPNAGVNWNLIPEFTVIPGFSLGGVTIDDIVYPGTHFELGSASGIQGNRFLGLTQWMDVLGDWDANWSLGNNFNIGNLSAESLALSGFNTVIGSAGNDTLKGNSDNNYFDLSAGVNAGIDIVDGRGQANNGYDTVKISVNDSFITSLETGQVFNGSYNDSGVLNAALSTITADDSTNRNQSVYTDANLGVFTLEYNGSETQPLAFNASAEQVQDALRKLPALEDVVVYGSGTSADPWKITLSPDTTASFSLLSINTSNITLVNTPANGDIRFGLYTLDSSGLTQTAQLNNIEAIESSNNNDLMFGNSGDNRYLFSADWGQDIIIDTEGNDQIEFLEDIANLNVQKFAGVDVYWQENSNGDLNYIIALNTEGQVDNQDGFNFNWITSPIETGSRALLNTIGSLEAETLGNKTDILSAQDADSVYNTVKSLWQATGNSSNFDSISLDVSQDLPGKQLAWYNADTKTIYLDSTAAGHGWFVDVNNSPAADQIDLLTVLNHEVGHALGLVHSSSDESLMNATLTNGVRISDVADLIDNAQLSDTAKLLSGLTELGNWSENLGSKIQSELDKAGLPLVGDALAALGLNNLDGKVGNTVSQFKNSVQSYLDNTAQPDVDQMLNQLVDDGFNIVRSAASSQAWSVQLEAVGFDQAISPDFNNWSLDSLPGNIELPFSASGDPLQVKGGVYFNFDFGLDEQANFFVSDPKLDVSLSVGDDLYVGTVNSGKLEIDGQTENLFAGDQVQLVDDDANLLYTTVSSVSYDVNTGKTTVILSDLPPEAQDNDLLSLRKTLDLDLNMGVVGLAVENGYIDFDAGMSLGYEGRLDIKALNQDDGSLAGLPDLNTEFEYDILLPVQASGALSGIMDGQGMISANSDRLGSDLSFSQLVASIPKSIEIQGLGDVFQISNISLDMILQALEEILASLENGGLDKDIPILGVSANDVLGDGVNDFVAGFRQAIAAARNADTFDELTQTINSEIQSFLGLGSEVQPFSLSYLDSTLSADFNLEWAFNEQWAMDLDLKEYDNTGTLDLLNLSASTDALLTLDALASVNFGIGIDASDITDINAYIMDDTGINLSFNAAADDVDMLLGFDFDGLDIGVQTVDGQALVEFFMDVGLKDTEGDRYTALTSSDFVAQAGGDVLVDLPMYFPLKAMPLGGSEQDRDGDGIADNSLYMDMGFEWNGGQFDYTRPNIAVPVMSFDFDLFNVLYGLINDPQTVLNSLETLFDQIDKLAENVDKVELPLIGGDAFDSLANDLYALRTNVLGHIDAATGEYIDGIGRTLTNASTVNDTVMDLVRQALYEGFDGQGGLKQINSTLFSFVVPELDEFGAYQYETNGQIKTRLPTSADDIELILTDDGQFSFNLMFGGELVNADLPLDFSVGIPGFSMGSDNAALETNITYLMGLGFGFDAQSNSVFLDTSGITASGEEISLDISSVLRQGSEFTGELGFLQMSMKDVSSDGSGIMGHLGIDLDAGTDGRWTIGETLNIAALATLTAQADIEAVVDTSLGDTLPEISTIVRYDQVLADISLSSGGTDINFGLPNIVLEDVTLNMGNVVDNMIKPVVDMIGDIVDPLTPLVDLLTMEIDIGVDKFQLIDLAYLRLPFKTVDTAKKVLNVIKETNDFVKTVRSLSIDGGINFGSFTLASSVLENEGEAGQVDPDSAQIKNAQPVTNSNDKSSLNTLIAGPDQNGLDQGGEKKFKIPVLEDPASVLNLLLGKGDVDLFWYDLPDLQLDFSYSKSVPIFPGLNGIFGGQIGASTNFDFGFDTRGLREWSANDFAIDKSYQVFNGFYMDDHGIENSGNDLPEASVYAGISAGLSLGVAGLVEAGITAGINANIDFDLNDKLTEVNSAGELVGDGKLYGDEVLDRLADEWYCLFDTHGQLTAFVEAFLWVGLDVGFTEITLFEERERFVDALLAEFNFECVKPAVDDIASLNNGELQLRYSGGQGVDEAHNYRIESVNADASLTTVSLLKQGLFDPDVYSTAELNALNNTLKNLRDDPQVTKAIIVSTGVRVEVFDAAQVNKITTTGTSKGDNYKITALDGLVNEINLSTGAGEDYVRLNSGTSSATIMQVIINAGNDDDRLEMDSRVFANFELFGGSGKDTIKLINDSQVYQSARLSGGSGEDVLFGGMNADTIYGDADPDTILAYGGDDIIYGGDEVVAYYTATNGEQRAAVYYRTDGSAFDFYNDKGRPVDASGNIIALTSSNHIVKGRLGDLIDAGEGSDTVYGGKGVDQLYGGKGDYNDVLYGQQGTDIIKLAGSGKIYGGEDSDQIILTDPDALLNGELLIDGEQGKNTLRAQLSSNSENLFIRGDANTTYTDNGTSYEALALEVGSKVHSLLNINRITIDAGDGADNLNIASLLNTEVTDVKIDLGSVQARAWQALRNGDGEQLTVATDYPLKNGQRFATQEGVFDFERDGFYQLELQSGGEYLYNDDGSPQIINLAQDYRTQIQETLNPPQFLVPLGSQIDRYLLNDTIDLNLAGLSEAEAIALISNKVESIDGIDTVQVTAVDGGYRVDILDASIDQDGQYPEIKLTIISQRVQDNDWTVLRDNTSNNGYGQLQFDTANSQGVIRFEYNTDNRSIDLNQLTESSLKSILEDLGISDVSVDQSDDNWTVYYSGAKPGLLTVTTDQYEANTYQTTAMVLDLEDSLSSFTLNYNGQSKTIDYPANDTDRNSIDNTVQQALSDMGVDATVTLESPNSQVKTLTIVLNSAATDLSGQFKSLTVSKILSLQGQKVQAWTGTLAFQSGSQIYAQKTAVLEGLNDIMEKRPVYESDDQGNLQATGEYAWFKVDKISADHFQDQLVIAGTADDDKFSLSHLVNDAGTPDDPDDDYNEWQTLSVKQTNADGSKGVSFTVRGIDLSDNDPANSADKVTIMAGAGNDTIDAGNIQERLVDNLYLEGAAGDDRIIGSRFAETIDGGSGDDVITGAGGVDQFFDSDGFDTLIEQRDLDFELTDERLRITGTLVSQDPETGQMVQVQVDEDEAIKHLFESVVLTGGTGNNLFRVHEFTESALLDGSEGADTYVLQLTGTPSGKSVVRIEDNGTGNQADEVTIWGDDTNDFFQLDVDKANNEGIVTRTLKENAGDLFDRVDLKALKRGGEQPEAEASPSDLFDSIDDYQRVIYNTDIENLVVHGAEGNDMFVSDYTLSAMSIYGDEGNDDFIIGRVLKTVETEVDGRMITVVDGADGITDGVSYNTKIFGGEGNDYFEVNHNVGILDLFGESGNDWFYLKTMLQKDADDIVSTEDNAETINVSGSYDQGGEVRNESDVLISYVNNNRVNISGGSGFDTLVLGGTALADTVYIYESAGLFRLYVVSDLGTGRILEGLENVENVAILTGQGDDTVYLYDVPEGISLTLNLGLGDDTVYVGGPEQTFSVFYPASSYTETVEHSYYDLQVDAGSLPDIIYDPIAIQPQSVSQLSNKKLKDFYEFVFPSAGSIPEDVLNSSEFIEHKKLLTYNLLNSMRMFSRAMIQEYMENNTLSYFYRNRLTTPEDYVDASGNNTAINAYNDYYQNTIVPFYNAVNSQLPPSYTEFSRISYFQWWGQLFNNAVAHSMSNQFYANDAQGLLSNKAQWSPEFILDLLPPDYNDPNGGFDKLQKSFNHYLMNGIKAALQGKAITISGNYIPDLYLNDVAPTSGAMSEAAFNFYQEPHTDYLNWANASSNATTNKDLWFKAVDLMFEINGLDDKRDDAIVEHYAASSETGRFSYRFDLPSRVSADRIMPENYDLSTIAGFVEINDSVGGTDTLVINAQGDKAMSLELDQDYQLTGDYQYDRNAVNYLTETEQDVLIETLENLNVSTRPGVLNDLMDNTLDSLNVTLELDEQVADDFDNETELRAYLQSKGYSNDIDLKVYQPAGVDFAGIKADYNFSADVYDSNSRAWDLWSQFINRGGENEQPLNNPSGKTLSEIQINYAKDGVAYNESVRAADYTGRSNLSDEERIKAAAQQLLNDLNDGYYTLPFYGVDANGNKILEAMAINRLNADVQNSDILDKGVYITADNWSDYYTAIMGAGSTVPEFNDASVDDLIRNGLNQTVVSDAQLPIQHGLIFKTSNAGEPEEVYIKAIYDDSGRTTGYQLFTETTKTVNVTSDFVTGRSNDQYNYFDVLSGGTQYGLWTTGIETVDINTGTEDDVITIKAPADIDKVNVNSSSGNDVVNVDVSALPDSSQMDVYTDTDKQVIDSNYSQYQIDETGVQKRKDNQLNIQLQAHEILNINTGNAEDVFNIQGTLSATEVYLDSGAGNDSIYVSSNAALDQNSRINGSDARLLSGDLDNIQGQLFINAAAGNNQLLISDLQETDGETVIMRQEGDELVVSGLAPVDIRYRAVAGNYTSGLGIALGQNDDTLIINDIFDGAGTQTFVYAGSGNDTILVEALSASLDAELFIEGETGDDLINAYRSNLGLTLTGNEDDDIISGSQGNDNIDAGEGDNLVFGNNGKDTINSGAGIDWIIGDEGEILTNADGQVVGIQTINSHIGDNDMILSGAGDDIIFGGTGSDVINAGLGNDVVIADQGVIYFNANQMTAQTSSNDTAGNDWVSGGEGNDLILGGLGNDVISGGQGSDTIIGDSGEIKLNTTNGSLVNALLTSAQTGAVSDGGGNDTIQGNSGNDLLFGGMGNDSLYAGTGNDALFGDQGLFETDGFNRLYMTTDIFQGGPDNLDASDGGLNIVFGGAGSDQMWVNLANDIAMGEYGLVRFEGNQVVQLDSAARGGVDLIGSTLYDLLSSTALLGNAHAFGAQGVIFQERTGADNVQVATEEAFNASHLIAQAEVDAVEQFNQLLEADPSAAGSDKCLDDDEDCIKDKDQSTQPENNQPDEPSAAPEQESKAEVAAVITEPDSDSAQLLGALFGFGTMAQSIKTGKNKVSRDDLEALQKKQKKRKFRNWN